MTTALEFVRELGLGWNLGNTFDAFPLQGEHEKAVKEGRTWTPEDQEKLWFNQPFTPECARLVKQAGFDTIRIPVTWVEWIDGDGHVDAIWMNAVRRAVDWSLDAGLKVMVNVHHDGGEGDLPWIRKADKDPDGVCRRFAGLWREIADTFKDYGQDLILEGGNEIGFDDMDRDQAYVLLERLNQIFVDTVRASGSHNADRFLLIPGYNTDTAMTCDSRYHLPKDSVADRMIVSIHYYSPADFALATHDTTWCKPRQEWGSEADVKAMEADFATQRRRFVDSGIPVIIGEYGLLTEAVDGKDHASNLKWISTVLNCCRENGSCPVLWDTSTKEMCFLDRTTGRFFDPDMASLFAQARADRR